MEKKTIIYLTIGGLLGGVAILLLSVPQLRSWLSTQAARDIVINKKVRITIPEDAPIGEHVFNINVTDSEGGELLAQSEQVMILVEKKLDTPTGNDGGGGGGGDSGGGGEGGGGGGDILSGPFKTYAFAPERGHEISDKNSGVVKDGNRMVVRLTGNTSTLTRKAKVPVGDYWLYLVARHDRPGPVKAAIYLNNKAWKIVTLDKNDDSYEFIRVGVLRNFQGGKISFRFTNDVYDKTDVANEALDRNLFIDSWALSTDPNLQRISIGGGRVAAGRQEGASGEAILPRLNQTIREELGNEFVVWDIWSYYAARLVAKWDRPEAITTLDDLRVKMRFWKIVRPERPRGE